MDLQPQLRDSDSDDGLHREPIIGSEAGWDAASDDTSDDNTEMGYFETFSSEDAGEREDDYDGGRGYKPVGSVRAAELHGRRAADYRYGTKIRHRRYYTVGELLMDKWLYDVDNEFKLGLSEMMDKWREHRSQTPPAKLCNDCHSRRVLFRCLKKEDRKQDLKIAKLRRSATSCELCGFFLRSVEKHVTEDKKVQIYRYCSMLKVVTDRWEDKESVPFLTILADPDRKRHVEDLQIGLPVLPSLGTDSHFSLLREWLRVCDSRHEGLGCRPTFASMLPTRVIDIGTGSNFTGIKLYCSKQDETGSYMALSHCWGKFAPEERERFCTFRGNFESRCKGINFRDLPKTFREAIQVVREIGQQYIWIDSLCIIQDDAVDWEKEAETMETVYSMAYCTIAATAAKDSSDGLFRPRQSRKFLKLENRKDEAHYLCEMIDDFHGDVETSILNSRGWVLQERGLSRRIIHFAENQTYWECGIGVHCATLTSMYKYVPSGKEAYVLGDPQFPKSLDMRTPWQCLVFFQSLFGRYSELGLTQASDRVPAIAGLEKRLAKGLSTQVQYGIVQEFFHRSLLWKRSKEEKLVRISYLEQKKVPTWSWMAYAGSISYLDVAREEVDWDRSIAFPGGAFLKARVTGLKQRIVKAGDIIADEKGAKQGELIYDQTPFDLLGLRLVVVGKDGGYYGTGNACYTLLLQSVGEGLYGRVGVGIIDRSVICFDGAVDGLVI